MKSSKSYLPRKLLAVALSLALAVTWMIPSSLAVYAGDEENEPQEVAVFAYNSGSGTAEDPGVISDAATLAAFAKEVDEGNHVSDYVKLGADIDLSGIENWNPIGAESGRNNVFNGSFDGAGRAVSGLNISKYDSSWMNCGLFSTLGGQASVHDLEVINANIDVDVPSNAMYARAGIVSGWAIASAASVRNVKTAGQIVLNSNGTSTYAGGVIGNMLSGAAIINAASYVDITINESGSSYATCAGGITASAGNNSIIANCAVLGDVAVTSEKVAGTVGGVAGIAAGVVANSYTVGSVKYSGAETKYAGALIGQFTNGTGTLAAKNLYYASDLTELDTVGTVDAADVAVEAKAMKAADMTGASLADTLNANLAHTNASGINPKIWTVEYEAVVPSGDAYSAPGKTWEELYNELGIDTSPKEAGVYDAVTSATHIASNRHFAHIPSVVNKVVSKDADGKAIAVLDGVNLTGKEASVNTALKSAYWETSRTKAANKQYGTDEFVVIPDDTVDGYAWDDYLANIYAVTISDGKTTVGALPWVDFYGEKANGNTASPHYNKVEIALNNSTTGVPVSGERNGEKIYRFDPFYTDEVLNAGNYTVTVYAEGYAPLSAEIKVPVYTDAKATVSEAKAASANVVFEGLPEDYGVTCKVDGNEATLDGNTLTYEAVLPGNHTLKVSDSGEKYNDFTASFVVMADAAAAVFDGTKIVKTDGASDEDFASYIANITSVTVNGKSYNATGRGSVQVVQNDGSIDLSKTDAAGATAPVAVVVSSTGYSDLEFEMYTGEAAEAAEAVAAANTAKSDAAKINSTDYTADSYKAVTDAIKALDAAIASNDVDAIKAATAALNSAVSSAKAKSNATIKVSPLKKTYKVKKLKKKAKKFQLKAAVSSGAKATFTKVSGNKKITVSKTGKVTVKKKLKKGTYKVKIEVAAPATANAKATSTTVTVVVKVKK